MARQIIILDVAKSSGGDFSLRCVFWLSAPANRTVARPSFGSVVPSAAQASWGYTAAELTALQNGTVVEQVIDSGQLPSGSTVASVKTNLQGLYATAQAALTATAAGSNFVGLAWDGTAWA